MAKYDDLNDGAIALIGGVGSLLVVFIVLLVQVIFYAYDEKVRQARQIDVPNYKADDVLAEQRNQLDGYAWVDRDKGIVSIPIDRAMGLVVQEVSKAQSASQPKKPVAAVPGDARVR